MMITTLPRKPSIDRPARCKFRSASRAPGPALAAIQRVVGGRSLSLLLCISASLSKRSANAATLPTAEPSATTSLDYSSSGYTGTIPTEFGKLTDVTSFAVYQNGLTGSVPSELGNLVKIESNHGFRLSYYHSMSNLLTGTVPTELGRFSHLSCTHCAGFMMQENKLTGTVPTQLGKLGGGSFKHQFRLDSNTFTGVIPTQLGRFTLLTYGMDLYSNNFCGDVPTELQALSTSVTTYYRVTTGNDELNNECPGKPTPVPTHAPSPIPTAVPSPLPTVGPSPLPSPFPTPLPSLMPTTGAPTAAPTPVPTPATGSPTAPPSPIPTSPRPSAIPSPGPTAYCGGGYEWNGLGCDECGVGKYSNLTAGKYNVSSQVRTCILCPAGRYQKKTGQGSCDACDDGELSLSDRSDCGFCSSGTFVYKGISCEKCPEGN
mmetsp:Transcript_104912/g.302778  ORF Transcript_104912/g.302778 Transcript_104912/m.302778 type:complete len:431 (+) Transcript_104912:77-1369(+)